MKKLFSLFAILLFTSYSYAQEKLVVGDKAPKINITDYVLNVPKDKNLENKYIILEFWATWCAPCLNAVPHINELQKQFKDKKDLQFISITNENVEKVKKTLEKIKFETVVVSDKIKKTEVSYGVRGIPHTVLIDNKGIIKWIGYPLELTSAMVEDFLADKTVVTDTAQVKNQEDKQSEEATSENNMDFAFKILSNKNTRYSFVLTKAQKNDIAMAMNVLHSGKYIDLNNSLKSILSKIIKVPESQIIISDSLANNKFNLVYVNSEKIDEGTHLSNLKTNLLNSFNFSETIESKTIEGYALKVVDAKKISFSTNPEEGNHSGITDTHLIFSNAKLETVIEGIENQQTIIIFNETGIDKNVDFIIKKGSLDDVIKDLKNYGLKLEKTIKEIDFYEYR